MTGAEIRMVLRDAAAVVRRGWCKCARAKDKFGVPVEPKHPDAVAWCALGAIEKICGGAADGHEAQYALRNIVYMDVGQWNDLYGKDGEHVARKLEEAAKYVS